MKLKERRKKIISWFLRHEKNIIFAVSLVLVAVISFELGSLFHIRQDMGPLVIEKPTVSLAQIKKDAGVSGEGVVAGVENTKLVTHDSQPTTPKDGENTENCMFVGSKNSDKYHSPSCSYAKRIKPENIVCFASEEDAQKKGYVAGCIE